MSETAPQNPDILETRWSRALSCFVRIHPDEVGPALRMTLLLFLLFSAYYIIKPIREGLILSMPGGAELKSSAGALQALFFILTAPLYRVFAQRFSGRRILIGIFWGMAANLLLFLGLGYLKFHYLGVVFYFWVGVFNMLTVSQIYSLSAELFTAEQGKRLFPLIALGAASGAVAGSYALKAAADRLGLLLPMAPAAVLLGVCALLTSFGVPKGASSPPRSEQNADESSARILGGVRMVFKKRYIALIAGMILVSNLINTNSEYMLGRLVSDHYRAALSGNEAAVRAAIGGFYAEFSLWVNLAVLALQAFAVSRVIRIFGVSKVLRLVPMLALFSYGLAVIFPVLAVLSVVKIAENAADYSISNTAREMLFLPLSTAEKYQAKLAADTVFRRAGDTLSRPFVYLIMEVSSLGISGFAGVNLALTALWGVLVLALGRERKRMAVDADAQDSEDDTERVSTPRRAKTGFRWQSACILSKIR